jgi:hypothetical protein
MKIFPYDKVFTKSILLSEEISRLANSGYSVLELPANLGTKEDIFEFVRNEFILDPLLGAGNSWDALADSIGGGMERHRSTGIMILVRNKSMARKEISTAREELIDILFQLKREQQLEKMKMYMYSATE